MCILIGWNLWATLKDQKKRTTTYDMDPLTWTYSWLLLRKNSLSIYLPFLLMDFHQIFFSFLNNQFGLLHTKCNLIFEKKGWILLRTFLKSIRILVSQTIFSLETFLLLLYYKQLIRFVNNARPGKKHARFWQLRA